MHGRARRPEPPPAPFELDVRIGPDQATVQVTGEIDMVSADQLATTLRGLLDQGCDTVELDMSGVGFLAAAGLAVLVEHDRRFRDASARLLVVRPSRRCARLFALTGVTEVLTVR
ncbi:STAS domain-containing protein [Pseudonocardia humida]|uniref:Anti-sigma factor antagonist n=1 Tax=Pseudonocardia humida TaxID=2800819 RepID=A0ABT1A2H3_9PSEU|nr:STAS domain-containing protein [Pseudonocardia humida]MCO1657188.1 STAS domain-containing protein [Pseudonocardia humida]